ncbi:MAG TPA: 4-phosphoerythronate dehydrogenase PdxB [Marinobacter sp.]|jgi:erythronate-4-phosphate dehydrogenase|nr:4-phosphoerythronate dehydrogenase PdxB [Marinobacter sp.]
MLIVADENIPHLDSFFADIGKVRAVCGRSMTAEQVREADILLVRSVTRVDEALLKGSRVRFVGTTTIGTDHVDLDYLRQQSIRFSAAPGCNANSVVEYVLTVLSLWAERTGMDDWADLSVGIVGAGNVGGELGRRLARLGFKVKLCDPPRAEAEPDNVDQFVGLEDALSCDVVTFHTPLNREGACPTWHLMNESRIQALKPGQLLINTSRGEVVDNQALLARLEAGQAPAVVLDVWENEPAILAGLVRHSWLATPHIAGYSLEGKVMGVEAIYQAVSHYLGLPARKQAGQFLPEPPLSKMSFTGSVAELDAANRAMRACYDPRSDDARLRLVLAGGEQQRKEGFDRLRRDYPVRREFSSLKLQLKGASKSYQDTFRALGFKVKV